MEVPAQKCCGDSLIGIYGGAHPLPSSTNFDALPHLSLGLLRHWDSDVLEHGSLAADPMTGNSPSLKYMDDDSTLSPILVPEITDMFDEIRTQKSFSPSLSPFASPSLALFDAVQCVRNECAARTESLAEQQSCQCASWIWACILGLSSSSSPQSRLFCAKVRRGTDTMCGGLQSDLVQAAASAFGDRVISSCFTERVPLVSEAQ